MSKRTSTEDIELVPAEHPARSSYERDFYSWSLEQARLVREAHWDLVDRVNVAEEIESLGREQFNKLESAFRVLLVHFLKWDYQPTQRSRSWILSVRAQRLEIEDILADNPGLKPRIAEAVTRAYRKARIDAAKATGLDEAVFPATCEYSYDHIASRALSSNDVA
jgi:Domain of unknown function DUF29